MSKHQWAHDLSRALSRRDFLAGLGAAGAGVAVAGLSACGGSTGDDGGIVAPSATGNIAGLVSSLAGVPQPGLGTLILMNGRGGQTGQRSSPDTNGRFSFSSLAPGEYQLRFNAPGLAVVPEPFPHPIRFSVGAGTTTDVPV